MTREDVSRLSGEELLALAEIVSEESKKREKASISLTKPSIASSLMRGFNPLSIIGKRIKKAFIPLVLKGAVDDASGMVMGLYFDEQETLRGYYEMMWQILTKYGIPEALYGDNRTICEFRKLSEKGQTIDRDVHIQFKRMCMQLGIELITTSVSQAKGRIERLWGHPAVEACLRTEGKGDNHHRGSEQIPAGIHERLQQEIFALKPNMETSLFAPAPSHKEINLYLSVQHERTSDNGSCFSFMGNRWQLSDEDGNTVKMLPKSKIDVYVARDGQILAFSGAKMRSLKSPDQAKPEDKEGKKVSRPKWKPGPNHPWRKFNISFNKNG